uniref:Ig-like domain-containing protein n=1 Tax=Labrus bergylta TaxID=56723 RepID=A0A3Q3FLJ5_9LABR
DFRRQSESESTLKVRRRLRSIPVIILLLCNGLLYFLASFLFTSCLVLGAEPPTKYVLKGTGESLKPTFSGQPNSILWRHNGNKVVEFDSREEQVYGAYKNRITLDWATAELEITGLKFEDRGLYEVEVDIDNIFYLSEFKLEVIVLGAEPPTKYVLKGTGESLKPTFSGQPNSILWRHNGNKVVEFDSREQEVYGAYKNRITLDWATAELEITSLKFEDRGLYEVEVDIDNMLRLSQFKLEVIDKVAMPTISCEINKDGGSDVSEVRATLLCSADPTPPESMMKFEWRARGKSQPGHKFNIPLGDERDNEEYSCSVSNPVSSETATFTAKDCYHACFAKGQQDDEEKQTEGNVMKMVRELNRRAGQEPVVDTEPRKGFVKEKKEQFEKKAKEPQQPQSITEPEKNLGMGEKASTDPPTDQTSPTLANSSPPKTERGPDEDPEDPAGV